MKKLTKEEVKHVARLANLKLKKEEIVKFQKQLSKILEYMEKLREVKTEGIEETSQVSGLLNVFREDKVEEERYVRKGGWFFAWG